MAFHQLSITNQKAKRRCARQRLYIIKLILITHSLASQLS